MSGILGKISYSRQKWGKRVYSIYLLAKIYAFLEQENTSRLLTWSGDSVLLCESKCLLFLRTQLIF